MSSSGRTNMTKMSKKDRDLEIMAVMAPVSAQNSWEKRDIEENNFKLLVARIVGLFSIFVWFVLFVICAVLASIGCCGSHTRYDRDEWEEQCNTDVDNAVGEKSGRWDCYHRNIYILITFCFALYLLIVGLTFIIAAQFMYGTERAEARQEQGLDDLAAAVKANAIEQRMLEREDARILREERAAARQAADEERRERTRQATVWDQERLEQERAVNRNPYAGARRYSVGSPATMRAPMPARTQFTTTTTTTPSIVYSSSVNPNNNKRNMTLVGRQPVVQIYAQPQQIQVRSNTTRYVV